MAPQHFDEQDVLLTFHEAAEFLRVSKATMNRWLASGQLVGYKVGRAWRFYKRDLHAFVAGQDRRGARSVPAPSETSPGSPTPFDLDLDVTTRTVTVLCTGTSVRLTPTETRLLHALLGNAGHSMSCDALELKVWGSDYIPTDNELDVYIARLRNKLEEDPSDPKLIQTVRGFGYRFAPIKAPFTGRPAETQDALALLSHPTRSQQQCGTAE